MHERYCPWMRMNGGCISLTSGMLSLTKTSISPAWLLLSCSLRLVAPNILLAYETLNCLSSGMLNQLGHFGNFRSEFLDFVLTPLLVRFWSRRTLLDPSLLQNVCSCVGSRYVSPGTSVFSFVHENANVARDTGQTKLMGIKILVSNLPYTHQVSPHKYRRCGWSPYSLPTGALLSTVRRYKSNTMLTAVLKKWPYLALISPWPISIKLW